MIIIWSSSSSSLRRFSSSPSSSSSSSLSSSYTIIIIVITTTTIMIILWFSLFLIIFRVTSCYCSYVYKNKHAYIYNTATYHHWYFPRQSPRSYPDLADFVRERILLKLMKDNYNKTNEKTRNRTKSDEKFNPSKLLIDVFSSRLFWCHKIAANCSSSSQTITISRFFRYCKNSFFNQ